jgi:hypothetical protein
MTDIIELNGGPYIVKRNSGGGFEFRYGWAELKILDGKNIKVICTDDDDVERTILNFTISNSIPRDYRILEKIQIYLKIGYNTIYAYNYSCIYRFKIECEKYFRDLDKQIEVNKEEENKKIQCEKCNGAGIIKK